MNSPKIMKIALCASILVPLRIFAQSNDMNYIRSDMMLDSAGAKYITSVQYYDGIGRPTLKVENDANTSGQYLYTLQEYDMAGRESCTWLPVVGGTNPTFIPLVGIKGLSSSTYQDNSAYSNYEYDALNRVVSAMGGGSEWHNADKKDSKLYLSNEDNSVKLYEAPIDNEFKIVYSGFYNKDRLYCEQLTDEDGKTKQVYRDMQDRKILERYDGNKDTYYVYNDYGQLRFVLSPEYQNTENKELYAYEYRYDNRGRCIEKILPGCESIKYWYDSADRMIFMQDPFLRVKGLFRFILYDKFSRPVVTGTCKNCNKGQDPIEAKLQNGVPGLCGTGYIITDNETIDGAELETANYYDNYDFIKNNAFMNDKNIDLLNRTVFNCSIGKQTGSITRTSKGDFLLKCIYYDTNGRIEDECSTLPEGAAICVHTEYSFTDKPTSSIITVRKDGKIYNENVYNTYYKANDKMENIDIKINNISQRICTISYDGLGRVIKNTRGDNAGDISYNYNLRGWTTAITGKGFKETLHYTDGPGTPCYNGNISSQQWQTDNESGIRGYKFDYDGMNRLTAATYGENADMSQNIGRYDEKITGYTANSAITSLQRSGKMTNGNYGLIDDLSITLNGNQLYSIKDNAAPVLYNGAFDFKDNTVSVSGAEYIYDGNGSLVSDANKGIANIEYDNMNNPRRIQFTNGNVTEYVYSADGEKLRTIHRTAVNNITVPIGNTLPLTVANTLSVDSTDYIGPFIFENNKPDKVLFSGGFCSFTDSNQPVFHYYTQDHLGNNRAVVNENGTLEQVTHYYPFGGVYGDAGLNASAQPYKYNGKELDRMHGLDWYDYGARDYDATSCQWDRFDKKAEIYYNVSPYVYCADNPLKYIDPDGNKRLNWIVLNNPYNPASNDARYISASHRENFYDESVVNIWAHGQQDSNRHKAWGIQVATDKSGKGESKYAYYFHNDVKNFANRIDYSDKEWRKRGNGHPIIVLHSCSTSQFAQGISAYKEFKDVIIIAPDATLYSSLKGEHIGGIATGKNWEQKKGGKWHVYMNGKTITNDNGRPVTYDADEQPGSKGFNYRFK